MPVKYLSIISFYLIINFKTTEEEASAWTAFLDVMYGDEEGSTPIDQQQVVSLVFIKLQLPSAIHQLSFNVKMFPLFGHLSMAWVGQLPDYT